MTVAVGSLSDRPAVLPVFRNYRLVPVSPAPELTENLTAQGPRADFQHECGAARRDPEKGLSAEAPRAPPGRFRKGALFGSSPSRAILAAETCHGSAR